MFNNKPKVELIAHTHNIEQLITSAAKMCYSPCTYQELVMKNDPETVSKFIKKIMSIGHFSVLEHAVFTFHIENISRVTEIQLVRKRTASPTFQSGRYVLRDNVKYTIPPKIAYNEKAMDVYMKSIEQSQKAYLELIDILNIDNAEEYITNDTNGIMTKLMKDEKLTKDPSMRGLPFTQILKKFDIDEYNKVIKAVTKKSIEDARYVQPQSIQTQGIITIDLRNLIDLIAARKCKRAQWEIRSVAEQMIKAIEPLLPNISKYIGAPCEFGTCPEGEMCCGKPYKKRKDNM